MREPRPWLEEDATEIEEALLLAGRTDGPSDDAGVRLLAAIQGLSPAPGLAAHPGLEHSVESGPAMGGAGAATSAKPVALLRWAKVGLFALALGGAVVAARHLARPRGLASSATPALSGPLSPPLAVPAEPFAPPDETVSPGPHDHLATPFEEDPPRVTGAGNARATRSSPTLRAREAGPEASASPLDRTLGDEINALDRAKQALDAHRSSEVLRLLDEYHRTFPQGRLRPEAIVLRIAALVQAGKRSAADSLASQLLADDAYKPYAPRIRSLMREAKP